MNDPLTPADRHSIVQLVREEKLLEAIKIYREKTGAGLKEAKDAIDLLKAGQERPPAPAETKPGDSAVIDLFQTKGKIAAIKLYREQRPGCGLKEAKEGVEALARQHGLREPGGGCFSVIAALTVLGVALGGGAWWISR